MHQSPFETDRQSNKINPCKDIHQPWLLATRQVSQNHILPTSVSDSIERFPSPLTVGPMPMTCCREISRCFAAHWLSRVTNNTLVVAICQRPSFPRHSGWLQNPPSPGNDNPLAPALQRLLSHDWGSQNPWQVAMLLLITLLDLDGFKGFPPCLWTYPLWSKTLFCSGHPKE